MSRLHYDTPVKEASAKQNAPSEFSAPTIGAPARQGATNNYLEKIAKLIPSEVIAGYLAMVGFVPLVGAEIREYVLWGIFGLCQVLTPVYLRTQAIAGRPMRMHLIVSSVAFAVWAFVTTGDKLVPSFYDAALASITLVAFSLVSAIIPMNK